MSKRNSMLHTNNTRKLIKETEGLKYTENNDRLTEGVIKQTEKLQPRKT